MNTFIRIISSILIASLLSACGMYGPLYRAPSEPVPQPVVDSSAEDVQEEAPSSESSTETADDEIITEQKSENEVSSD